MRTARSNCPAFALAAASASSTKGSPGAASLAAASAAAIACCGLRNRSSGHVARSQARLRWASAELASAASACWKSAIAWRIRPAPLARSRAVKVLPRYAAQPRSPATSRRAPFVLAQAMVRLTAHGQQLGILRQLRKRHRVIGNRVFGAAGRRQQFAAIAKRHGQARIQMQRAIEVGQRAVQVALLCTAHRAIVQRQPALRIPLDCQLECLQRFVFAPLVALDFTRAIAGPSRQRTERSAAARDRVDTRCHAGTAARRPRGRRRIVAVPAACSASAYQSSAPRLAGCGNCLTTGSAGLECSGSTIAAS